MQTLPADVMPGDRAGPPACRPFRVQVSRVERLTPSFRQVTFAAPDLPSDVAFMLVRARSARATGPSGQRPDAPMARTTTTGGTAVTAAAPSARPRAVYAPYWPSSNHWSAVLSCGKTGLRIA